MDNNLLKKPIVIDNGTGYTKMGYGGNLDPDFVIPSAIADVENKSSVSVSSRKNDEYNFSIGNKGIELARNSSAHKLLFPLQDGLIENWDLMEKFWHQSIYGYLKADPQEHCFVLTEPPMNPPENRESVAEIFFETFNVPGLYIGVQAVFAMIGCNQSFSEEDNSKVKKKKDDTLVHDQVQAINSLTGIVIDSGDGVTHIVPVCDGYVLGSNIKHIPIAGRKITKFIMDSIKDRNENISTQDLYFAAMEIKEKHGYLTKDIVEEFCKWDEKIIDDVTKKYTLGPKFKKYQGIGKTTNSQINIDLGYEIFLGPESFFAPEIIDKDFRTPIDELLDNTVQQCPVDYRRKLYSNIVLSGGSTMFKFFDKRLEKQVQSRVNDRLENYEKKSGVKPKAIGVNVTNSVSKQHSVWFGGSIFSTMNGFEKNVHTRAEYLEKGPSCCRFNPVFGFS